MDSSCMVKSLCFIIKIIGFIEVEFKNISN